MHLPGRGDTDDQRQRADRQDGTATILTSTFGFKLVAHKFRDAVGSVEIRCPSGIGSLPSTAGTARISQQSLSNHSRRCAVRKTRLKPFSARPVEGSAKPAQWKSTSLELVEMAGPVVLQKPRQRPIGQDPSARLATRAIVCLVIGITNPLDGCAADGTRLAEPAVDGHFGTKGGDLLGESRPRLLPQPIDPPV